MNPKRRLKRQVKGKEEPEGFLRLAREFVAAGQLVLNRTNEVSFPAYFLFGRAIELSLKAFLLRSTLSIDVLSRAPYGHNLVSLLETAINDGLANVVALSAQEQATIQLLSDDYTDKRFEYPVAGATYHLPLISETDQVAMKLLRAMEAPLGSTDGDA